jgi:hypothetical protein
LAPYFWFSNFLRYLSGLNGKRDYLIEERERRKARSLLNLPGTQTGTKREKI